MQEIGYQEIAGNFKYPKSLNNAEKSDSSGICSAHECLKLKFK